MQTRKLLNTFSKTTPWRQHRKKLCYVRTCAELWLLTVPSDEGDDDKRLLLLLLL